MLKIDIDHFAARSSLYLCKLLFGMPRPFFIRKSSSGKGFHIAVPSLADWDYRRFIFDDEMRIRLDAHREQIRLPISNVLWDIKGGKRAYPWTLCATQDDALRIVDSLMENYICAKSV